MKILYAIQATGNGHAARAIALVPILQKYAEVDVFMSGRQCDLQMPFEIKYKSLGFSFLYDKKGGLSYLKTLFYNNPFRILKEIRSFDLSDYDLVINDFECISAWAAKRQRKPCLAMSHQASFLSPHSPRPIKKDKLGEWVLRHYAPSNHAIGFHFKRYDDFIYPPVLRQAILKAVTTNQGHYTVYLPAYSDEEIIKWLEPHEVEWQVFSKHAKEPRRIKNIYLQPAHNERFTQSLVHSAGLLSSAGFESPAEALYLGKKLMVVPIQGQYEQYCNAAALEELGAQVCHALSHDLISKWLHEGQSLAHTWDDFLEDLIVEVLKSKNIKKQSLF